MIASLNNEGVMGVVVPHGVLFRGSSEGEIRKGIIESDLLEAVIGLPPSLFYGTGIPAALLIINKQKDSFKKGKVLFINAELDFQERKNQNILTDLNIEKILSCFDSYEEINRFSKVISLQEIRDNNHNLNIRRYADTSPPPEIFDVQGILHGEIPIQEIEDDYIQEVLDDFDLSIVLVNKNSEYMQFKREIKEKSQIRQLIGNTSDSVIEQLEKWWDKYGISLSEIDSSVKESEASMHGILKDLGYE
tara:strand:- start:140 stop:883 length:744 start_codon:yes stop_codon:yes gene_type:complete